MDQNGSDQILLSCQHVGWTQEGCILLGFRWVFLMQNYARPAHHQVEIEPWTCFDVTHESALAFFIHLCFGRVEAKKPRIYI